MADSENFRLLPYISLFAILIPVLYSVSLNTKLGLHKVKVPETSNTCTPGECQSPIDKLLLTVMMNNEQLDVQSSMGVLASYKFDKDLKLVNPAQRTNNANQPLPLSEEGKAYATYLKSKASMGQNAPAPIAIHRSETAIVYPNGTWFYKLPKLGEKYRYVGEKQIRTVSKITKNQFKMKHPTVFNALEKDLDILQKDLLKRQESVPDMHASTIIAKKNVIYDRVIQIMDILKNTGFQDISLSLLQAES